MSTTHQLQGLHGLTWIGLYLDGTEWKWTDGTAVDWSNWARGQPSYDREQSTKRLGVQILSEWLVSSSLNPTKWNDLPLENEMRTYVCKKADNKV